MSFSFSYLFYSGFTFTQLIEIKGTIVKLAAKVTKICKTTKEFAKNISIFLYPAPLPSAVCSTGRWDATWFRKRLRSVGALVS
jgi:hypothetical protein